MAIQQFTKFGFSVAEAISVTGSLTVHALSSDSDIKFSSAVPVSCYLDSIEFELSALTDGDIITMFLARDSAGDVPITSIHASGASQKATIGKTSTSAGSAKGGCSFTIGKDFHYDSTVSNSAQGTLYLVVKCLDGSGSAAPCTADVRLNWRA